jgi:hypothetical protein
VFSATDWRANRLVDALAKSVARGNAVTRKTQETIASAVYAAKHAGALLGTVTHAANHHKVETVRRDGSTYWKEMRDSVPHKRTPCCKGRNRSGQPLQRSADKGDSDGLDAPEDHSAILTISEDGTTIRRSQTMAQTRATARREHTIQRTKASIEATAAIVQSAAASLQPDPNQQSAKDKMSALVNRIKAKTELELQWQTLELQAQNSIGHSDKGSPGDDRRGVHGS